MIQVEVANRQSRLVIDSSRLVNAGEQILAASGWHAADVSIVLVDDEQMQRLNREYLSHDYTTDVLSFVLDDTGEVLSGEVIVCTEVAQREAIQRGSDPRDELLLYTIHGLLHLVGYRDKQPSDAARMRVAEEHWLVAMGVPRERLPHLSVATDDPVPSGERLR
jgi:probable rRNA maturation factor